MIFKISHAATDRRFLDAERRGRLAKATVLSRRKEIPDLAEFNHGQPRPLMAVCVTTGRLAPTARSSAAISKEAPTQPRFAIDP